MAKANEATPDPLAAHKERAARQWAEYLREDPELARLELGIARCARIMVETPMASPIYAAAIAEDRKFRADRRALLLRRHDART